MTAPYCTSCMHHLHASGRCAAQPNGGVVCCDCEAGAPICFCEDCAAYRAALCAEIARLLALVEDAPHDTLCHAQTLRHTRAIPEGDHCKPCPGCDCWKSTAREEK